MDNTTKTDDVPFPTIDEGLGEKLYPDEATLTTQIADHIEKTIREQYQAGNALRDVHAKATGCVKAEFRVNQSIPDGLAKGVFIPGKVYQALIRFSNGSGDPNQSDDHNDGRGMAIKLLGVPGQKLLETDRDATSQDFIMINHPVFLLNDPHTYLSLIQKASGNLLTKLTIPFTLGLKGTLLARELNLGKISNPLQTQYYSAVPYQLGVGPDRQAVKFSVKPSSDVVDHMPDHPGPNFLREAMRTTLQQGDVTMKFMVQPRTTDGMSVEDSMNEWDQEQAPFHEVATIVIPKQDFDTTELNKLGETLSFNPWHSLPEHRPLGSLNRTRKIVYERISRVRNGMNSVPRQEP
ncbi:heme-dependent catalase [Basidiobolus meristosporus CBS 931.73]|uniref:Heme-dependent catalase n=1 Tax=Basidiobolus meristosporus CBS 931.73 TaxID=1314790 RepID=A0A1Y1YNR3_9FUNG|nr:heme-dependent catalase [Basidiobolus meristosporus CBS 931.73]|eukprot:ORX99473.1 heme-dependent catalase [Basidiobolus meristosporus CBS 931.73]